MVSNVGIAMFDTATGWFMTNLSHDPMLVSLVQAATSLPLFLFTVPAGALTDIVDPRRLLIVVGVAVAAISDRLRRAGVAGLREPQSAARDDVSARRRRGAVRSGLGLDRPACWCRPRISTGRSPPIPSATISAARWARRSAASSSPGSAYRRRSGSTPSAISSCSRRCSGGGRRRAPPTRLPAERLSTAIRTGLRHAKNNSHLHSTLVRTLGFFPVRERLLGAAAAGGAQPDDRGPRVLRPAARLDRRRRDRRFGDAQLAQGQARPGSAGRGRRAGDRGRAGPVRPRARPGDGYRRLFHRRRRLDPGAGGALCLGAGRAARLGARTRACDLPHADFRRLDPRQRDLGADRRPRRPGDRPLHRRRRRR